MFDSIANEKFVDIAKFEIYRSLHLLAIISKKVLDKID